tara:strand:- start:3618 stop:4418 length:801 start_codon:yes stop_codon:yes gene_type:complete
MLNSLLMTFFVNNLRQSFPRFASYLSFVLSTIFSLIIYYYTSRAFAKSFFDSEVGYFEYILVGELSLLVVSSVLYNSTTLIRSWKARGIFDYLLAAKASNFKIITLQLLSTLARDVSMVVVQLALATLFFDLTFSASKFLVLILFPLLALPLFLSFGFLSLSLILYFGRGGAVVTTLTNVLSFLSGVFFPISVLPHYLQRLSLHNPFSAVLLPIRNYFSSQSVSSLMGEALPLLGWSICFIGLGVLAFKLALVQYKRDNNRFSFDY